MEILVGVLLILLGVAVIGLPMLTSLSVVLILAITLVVAGFVHVFGAFRARSFGAAVAEILIGLAYIVIGIVVQQHPLWGVSSLAFVISAVLIVEGVVSIAAYFIASQFDGSLWHLMGAILTLVFGFAVWNLSATSPALVVTAIVAANLIATGISRIMMAIAVRRLVEAIRP